MAHFLRLPGGVWALFWNQCHTGVGGFMVPRLKYRDICFTPWRALSANGVWCPPARITALPDRRRVGDTERAPTERPMELLSRVRHHIKPHFLVLWLGLIDVGVMLPAWKHNRSGFLSPRTRRDAEEVRAWKKNAEQVESFCCCSDGLKCPFVLEIGERPHCNLRLPAEVRRRWWTVCSLLLSIEVRSK